jgi:transcriptional regulator with XRE-family HTH domain
MSVTQVQVGSLLRDWRQRRRLSQLELALDADVSARHLSFVETGRSRPSASMVLHLAERLEVPLRERNRMLLAAGHAPAFQSHDLDEPPMAPVRAAIDLILEGHDPYPALVVDRAWEMIAANRAVSLLTADVAPHLLEPPVNVLRVSLHPDPAGARPGAGDRGAAAPERPGRRARVHLDGRDIRDRGGGHRERARDRVVLPGRRRDRRRGARARRAATSDLIDTLPSTLQGGSGQHHHGGQPACPCAPH